MFPIKELDHSLIKVMFSCTLPAYSSDRKDAKKQKEKERKKSLSKGKDRYTIVKGIAGGPDGISFESATKKKNFLRVRDNNILIVEPYDDSEDYRKQSTFIPLQDMWFSGYIVFESLVEPAHFIRRCAEQLVLQKYENTPFFKEDASFKLTRKRCIACVKIGSRVWARIEKGCFLRGTVVAVDDMVHIALENGNKVRHKKFSPITATECDYVPDIIPHPLEIEVGTRVLARWFNRHDSYYPAIITGIRRNFFNVKYDDGDKGTNNINEIRILKQPEVEGGNNIPSWSSLDGLPRVGGLCIDSTGEQSATEETSDGQEAIHERWMPSPADSHIHDRPESPSDQTQEEGREVNFGYENNLQYLSPPPCIQPINQHAPVERNVSQVSGGSTDSGYHDSACAGSARQRRTGLWADMHSNGRPLPVVKNPDKEPWDHEDALSDNETSNSTNYSTTHDLDLDNYTPAYPSNFSQYHPTAHAPSHASHAESHGGDDDSHDTRRASHSDIPETHATSNGGDLAPNGPSVDDTRRPTQNGNLVNHIKTRQTAKPVPPRPCPIHHHKVPAQRLQNNTHQSREADDYESASILSRESPRFIGMETVI